MKHMVTFARLAIGKIALIVAVAISPVAVLAQANVQAQHVHESDPVFGDSLDGFNPDAIMQIASSKGLQPAEAAMFLARAKRSYINRKYNLARTPRNNDLASMRYSNPNVAMVPCTNMDFETGDFTGWTGFIGDNTVSSNGPLQNIQNGFFSNGTNALVTDNLARHTIMANPGAGTDACGGFSCVYPGGNYSVRLGNSYANYQGEAIEQTFTVGAGNTSFTYNYAVVLNDGGHSSGEQPYFRIEMYDQSGNLIPCAQYYVEASGTIPGFVNCGVGTSYKPWTTVNADLTNYLTQSVTIRFTAAGCIYAGHYGYAYVDCSCLPYQITTDDSLCVGNSITLSAPIGAQSYQWSTGDTTVSINVSNPGSYSVIMTSVTGCQTTLTLNVGQYPPPTAAFTPNAPPCSPNFTFQNNSSISNGTLSYYWDFGDPATLGDTSNATNPTYNYPSAGTYTVTLVVISNNGCSDTATAIVNPGASAANFSFTTVCAGETTQFTDLSNQATGWDWDFGDPASGPADSSNLQNPSHTFSGPGTYTVTLTAQTNPCVSIASFAVTVNAQPSANFSSTPVCVGSATTFTDLSLPNGGTITSWTWDFGDGSPTSNLQNPTHMYPSDTTYNITLIVQNAAGCVDTIVLQSTPAPTPVVAFLGDTLAGCPVHCVDFTDQTTISAGTITAWAWDFGDGSIVSLQQNPSHCYTQSGTYTVTLTAASSNGCATTLIMPDYVEVYPVPVASFSANPQYTTILDTHIDFTDLSSGVPVSWTWDLGDPSTTNDTSSMQNTFYDYSSEYGGIYPVWLQVTNQYGCVDDTMLEVIVEPEFTFFIPNAFTPNGDGKNDLFFGTGIGIQDYELWVFDRWGNLIYHTTNINEGWNGTVQGASGDPCQVDVYVWKVALTDVFHKKHKYIGHVSLIR
jgi:gliding motility-associated-like protein